MTQSEHGISGVHWQLQRRQGVDHGGGTSAGAPQWAAIVALAKRGADNADQRAGRGALHHGRHELSNVLSRCDAGNNGGYSATPRYDFVTGLGARLPTRLSRV